MSGTSKKTNLKMINIMMDTLICMAACFLLLMIVYFGASVFVYTAVFGYDTRTALKYAARELLFWKEINNNEQ